MGGYELPTKWGTILQVSTHIPVSAVISDRGTKETTEPRDGIDDVEMSNALSHLQGKIVKWTIWSCGRFEKTWPWTLECIIDVCTRFKQRSVCLERKFRCHQIIFGVLYFSGV